MDRARLHKLLEDVRQGSLDLSSALEQLKDLPFQDLGFAKLDHHRDLRRGFPEVILGEGKTADQIVQIAERLADDHQVVLATRLSEQAAEALLRAFPAVRYHAVAHFAAVLTEGTQLEEFGDVVVVSAGTADVPVAEEAALTATYMGNKVTRLFDLGVSGLQRLLAHRARLAEARVVVAVAGMDAALAAVLSGLIDTPVVAVPTSVGYGTAFGGVAPLLTMLNSCSSGVGVVNIDNGFGAGHLASLINQVGRERLP